MKKLIQLLLIVVIILLGWILVKQFVDPMRFDKERKFREEAIIQRLKDIRSAQKAYRQVKGYYTNYFDTLIKFVLNDSLTYQRSMGSADDSVAVAQGLYRVEEFKMAVKDTIYSGRGMTEKDIREIRMMPYSGGKEFIMGAGELETESRVIVQVFEAKAPFKDYLGDLDEQLLINLIDEWKNFNRYPGLKVGSLTEATNDAGNWE